MKNTTIITMAALLLGSSGLMAQTTAFTKPSGFVTHTLKAGQYNLIGLTLHNAVTVSGKFTAVAGTALTDTNIDFDASLLVGETYILEITSGTLSGSIQEMSPGSWSGDTLTTAEDLVADGLSVNDTYQLRKAATLASVFGAGNESGLLGGASSVQADGIYFRNNGGYDIYYYSTGGFYGTGWRKDGGGSTDYGNLPIIMTDGFYVYRRGVSDLDIVLTGAVKTISMTTAIIDSLAFISGAYPVGSTLDTSGIQSSLTGGASAANADNILFKRADGGFDTFYYSTGGFYGTGWRKDGDGNVDHSATDLPSAFLLRRVSNTDFNLKLNPPAGYENL